MRKLCTLLLLIPLISVAPLPAAAPSPIAGVILELEITDPSTSDAPQVVRTLVAGQNLRMGMPSDTGANEGEMIFRGDRREMIAIDHERRSYTVIDQETLESLMGQMSEAMRQMEEAMKNVPPEQRAMVEEMMRGRMGGAAPGGTPPSELRNTGDRANQHGYPSRRYEVVREGRVTSEMWVTDWENVEGSDLARPAFEGVAAFVKELMTALAENPLLAGAMVNVDPYAHLTEMNGFPVVTRDFADDGSLETEAVLRSATRTDLDPADFEPPAGYARQDIGGR